MVTNGGYTELIHAGDGVEIEKGVISATGGGGGGSFKIVDTVDAYVHTLDKSWNEIMSAVTSGLIPYVVQEIEGLGTIFYAPIIEVIWDNVPTISLTIDGSIKQFTAEDGDSPLSFNSLS